MRLDFPIRMFKDWDPEKHPRHPAGAEESQGGRFAPADEGAGTAAEKPYRPDPLVDVGGDEWNKATAERLAREYEAAAPKLREIYQRGISDTEQGRIPMGAESWEQLTSGEQSAAEEKYISANYEHVLDAEIRHWREEVLPEEAAEAWKQNEDKEPLFNTRNEVLSENPELQSLIVPDRGWTDALYFAEDGYQVEAANIPWNTEDPRVAAIERHRDSSQQTLPGVEPLDINAAYQQLWEENFGEKFSAEFEKQKEKWIESYISNASYPDYVSEQADEIVREAWSNRSDEEKFEEAKKLLDLDGIAEGFEVNGIREPGEWQPFRNDGDSSDYHQTRINAEYLTRERTLQLFDERAIGEPGSGQPYGVDAYENISRRIWDFWKDSSTSTGGHALQLAAVEELGARSRWGPASTDAQTRETIAWADQMLPGGFEALKAYTRAQWETSQYVLSQAGVDEFTVYRGLILPGDDLETMTHEEVSADGQYFRLPDLNLLRNGAASATSSPSVANGWDGVGAYVPNPTRVVMRVAAPRTAALSLPVFGQNLAGEQEVVLLGTAWNKWDAWLRRAPDHRDAVIKMAVSKTPGVIRDGKKVYIDLNELEKGQPHWLNRKARIREKLRRKYAQRPVKKTAGRILYVARSLTNVEEFRAWAREQGFKDLVPDPHVTLVYSSRHWTLDEKRLDEAPLDTDPIVVPGGHRMVARLGDEGAIVLKFESDYLHESWEWWLRSGATWEYESYQPHVTITYAAGGPDLREVVPYLGELHFGPEFKDWTPIEEKVEKAGFDPSQPRDDEGQWTDSGGGTPDKVSLPAGEARLVKPSKGSNPGGFYETESGERYFVKFPHKREQVGAEITAAYLARAMGMPTKENFPVAGGRGVASRMVEIREVGRKGLVDRDRDELADHFVHAALTRNWDAVGLAYDNLVEHDGTLMTIDYGGSLYWRAQGGIKPGGMPAEVGELTSMRDRRMNEQAANVFGQLSDADVAVAIERHPLPDATIRAAVSAGGFEPKVEVDLIAALTARRDYLIDWASRTRVRKHMGPGDHPSGSSQDVHSGGGERQIDDKTRDFPKIDPEDPFLDKQTQKFVSSLPSYPQREDLDQRHKDDILEYQKSSTMLNQALRDPDWLDSYDENYRRKATEKVERERASLDTAIDRSPLPRDLVLYRGIDPTHARHLEVGDEYVDLGFQSFTVHARTAGSFAQDQAITQGANVMTVLRVRMEAGERVLWMGGLGSKYQHEFEFLVPRGTAYKVTGIEEIVPFAGTGVRERKTRLVTLEKITG